MNYSEIAEANGVPAVELFGATEETDTGATVDQPEEKQYEKDDDVEQYYRELELSHYATQEEIKSQYKQLVRLHHPDQFIDLTQKRLAEDRLKSINEAYRILSSRAVEGQLVKFMQRELGLVVEPAMIDFGLLERRQKRTATFYVRFEKDVEGVDFVPSEEDGWFRVTKVSHIYGNNHASLEFEVAVDTTGLATQTHQGWIDIYLDGTMTRMPLTLAVVRRSWQAYQIPRGWMLAGTFILAFLLFTTALAFTNAGSFTQSTGASINARLGAGNAANSAGSGSPNGLATSSTQQLYFSILEQGQPTIYTTLLNRTANPLRIAAGTEAVGIEQPQMVAYLDRHLAQSQIILSNQATGSTVEITTGNLPKSQLAWSNGGQYLAYLVGTGTTARIGVYEPEKNREYRLPGEITAGVSNYAWSPDGKSMLFDLWRDNERRVYRMAVPDGELHQLTHFDSWAGTWSPDGNAVIVASAKGLYRLDQSGRQLRQISNEAAESPHWSVDGAWVAYLAQPIGTTAPTYNLWLMRPDGSAAQQVASDVLWHAWSPLNATLGYVTGNRQSTDSLFYLWTVETDGQPQLVAEVNNPHFSWAVK